MNKAGLFLLFAAMSILSGCSSRERYVSFSGFAQGGTYSVKLNLAGVRNPAAEVDRQIAALLEAVDTTLSGYNKASVLSRRNSGEDVATNALFDEVMSISAKYKSMSGGAFDVASAPLFDVWGFGFTRDSLPSPEDISLAMQQCESGVKLNFNAIAQGYTCDIVARYLHSIGVHDMLVDIGEIYCEGLNPSGRGWSIGIDTPVDGNVTPGAMMSGIWQSDGGPHGVVTSGNYRKFYIRDGRKYAHTIDPRTGYPVDHDLLSATVVAPTAADADALATWYMVVGFEQARDLVLGDDSVEACLITSDTTWFSPGFSHR